MKGVVKIMSKDNLSKGFFIRYKWLILSVGIITIAISAFVGMRIKANEKTKVNSSTSEITSIINPSSTNSYNPKDAEKMEAITSLDDWDKLNYDGKTSKNTYDFFFNMLSGKSKIKEYNTLVIKDYKIYHVDSGIDTISYLGFDFTVEKSGLEELPVGKYHKVVRDIIDCYLTDTTGDEYENRCGDFAGIEEVEMVDTWISSIFAWDCPKFGEGKFINRNYMVYQYGIEDKLLLEDFIWLSKEKFGIEINDLSEYYIEEKDGRKYVTDGGIGGHLAYKIKNYQAKDNIAKVTVQFYADCNSLIPSHLVEYSIERRGIWLGYELLKKSEYEPYGAQQLFS